MTLNQVVGSAAEAVAAYARDTASDLQDFLDAHRCDMPATVAGDLEALLNRLGADAEPEGTTP